MGACGWCGKTHGYSQSACKMANPTIQRSEPDRFHREAAQHALRPHATALRTANRPAPIANRASDKQVNYVLSLLDKVIANIPALREGAVLVRETVQESVQAGTYTKAMASKMIDKMTAELAKAPKNEPDPKSEVEKPKPQLIHLALYYYGGKAYRARKSISSGNFYMEELVLKPKPKFVYARGVIVGIRPEHLMPPEQAAMFSKTVGACCNCLRELTANESLRRGYGPVCAARHGWPYDSNAD